ncbi:MAG: peptidase domain-containing ABC transporter [Victivallales bacterium]|nr:peptidase domain-containing ABC transporter [Victivallales bacterium]
MENQETIRTGIECLRGIAATFCRGINFDSLLDGELLQEYAETPENVLVKLAERLLIGPELCKDIPVDEAFNNYRGPVLCKLDNENWICVVNAEEVAANKEQIRIFDPLGAKQKHITVPLSQLKDNWSGTAIRFKKLFMENDGRNTALRCLASVGKHNGADMDMRRLLHEYAVEDDEINEQLFFRIVSDYKLKTKKLRLSWDKLPKMGEAFPCIARTRAGKFIIVCGFRKTDKPEEVVIINPAAEKTPGQPFIFWERDKFETECAGTAYLVKKVYSMLDENQPFGLRWFIPEFMKLKGLFGQIALAVLMISGIALITPLFFQIVVDKVLTNNSYTTLNVLGVGIILALLFNSLLEFLRGYLLIFATNKIDISTATKTFQHLMRLPVDFFERMSSGVLIKHMQQTEKIRGFLSGNLFFTILELFSLVVFIPFLLIYSVKLTMIVLGFAVLMALVIAALIKPFQSRLHELYQAEGKRQGMLVEAIHGIRTVKSLAIEPVQEKTWNDSSAFAITRYFRVGKISLTAKTISQFLEKSMTVAIIWVGALAVFDKEMSVGALIAFQMLAGRVTAPLVKLVSLIHEYQQTALSVRMLGNVMNTPMESSGGGIRNPLHGNISFEKVTFRYTPDTPEVIKQFDLNVPAGATLGIVGRSGSGKTTLTKLLQGLYSLQSGLVKIDGIDIKEIDKAHLRTSIGVVLQDNYFFHGTVRENICLTKKNASMEEIFYATRLAGADDFVQQLTKGYDSVLEENASNLSGGQKQRLAIARALLTNPPVLIFDEATSALDPESESIIQDNLKKICKGRTVIIISHRLSMVHGADMILVMDNGEKTALAPHAKLVKQPGVYREFWQQQMGRYQ